MRKIVIIGAMALLVAWCTGCGPSWKDAVRLHKQGQKEEALEAYRKVASRSASPKALDAQVQVLALLAKMERWRQLPTEGEKLASFLDPEDDWARLHKPNASLWKQGKAKISRALLENARHAFVRARDAGDPVAYVASGKLYGLFIERFPKDLGRIEAAAGRGVALAVRGDCGLAMKLFDNASRWAVASSSLMAMQDKKPPKFQRPKYLRSRQINRMLFRGSLGCRIALWQEYHAKIVDDVRDRKRKVKQAKAMSDKAFERVLTEAKRLIRFLPRAGAVDLIRHATSLQRGGIFSNSLRLLLVVMDESKVPGIIRLAESKALRAFGASNTWAPMLEPLRKRLEKIPPKRRSLFWRRVQQLVVIHGVRKAQQLLKENQRKKAGKLLTSIFRGSKKNVKTLKLFYKAALILEEKKQLAPAAEIFKGLFERHPKHRMAPMALYRHADLSKKLNKLPDAAASFEQLALGYPKLKVGPRVYIAARALYEAYHAYRRMGDFRQARRILRWLFRRYPRALSTARMKIELRRGGGRLPRMRRRRRRRRRRRIRRQRPSRRTAGTAAQTPPR